MKRKITRVDGKEFCTIEIELRERIEGELELSICGVHGDIVPDENAQEQALEYWASFFDDNPCELHAMNERCGTEFTDPEEAAQFVLDSDGQYHGLDVMQEEDGNVFVGTSFGQIREELERFFPEATPYFKWHLNGMNAGCEHQEELGWGHGRTVALSRDDATAPQREAMDSIRAEKVKRERETQLKILFDELTTRDRVITFLSKYMQRKPTMHEVNMVTIHDSLEGVLKSKLNTKERKDISSAFDKYLAEYMDTIPEWKGSVFEDSLGAPCPVCGYRYGTQWLYRELPADVIEWAKTFGTTNVNVNFDTAHYVGDEQDGVYYDVAQSAADTKWYGSAVVDSETGSFTENLVNNDGPYATEQEALDAMRCAAVDWCVNNRVEYQDG